jgi:hypothetical protein
LDTPSQIDSTDGGDTANKSLGQRMRFTNLSKEMTVCSSITNDFLKSDNHLTPGNKLTITFQKANDNFLLMNNHASKKYKVVLTDLRIYYNRIRLHSRIPRPLNEQYIYTKTIIKDWALSTGLLTKAIDILPAEAIVPKTVVFFQVLTEAVSGDQKKNPYHLQHANLTEISLRYNGRNIPSDGLQTDFTNDKNGLVRAYHHMFANTARYRNDRSNVISMDMFKAGYTLFPFDLTPDKCGQEHIHEGRKGTLSLHLEWSTGLANPITIFTYLAYDQLMRIDKFGRVECVTF